MKVKKVIRISEKQKNSICILIIKIRPVKTKMTIRYWEIIFPLLCIRDKYLYDKRVRYDIARNYIIKKLCIKQYLSQVNELEKLKTYTLHEDLKSEYYNEKTPLPNRSDEKSVWENPKITLKRAHTFGNKI